MTEWERFFRVAGGWLAGLTLASVWASVEDLGYWGSVAVGISGAALGWLIGQGAAR